MEESLPITLSGSIYLDPIVNPLTDPTINWSPDISISCTSCLNLYIRPFSSISYALEITSLDGCKDRNSFFIQVQKFRKFFAPTVFSPNQDGANDLFFIPGGPEVLDIQKLQIYDRWGNMLLVAENMAKCNPEAGWDGYFNDKLLNSGTYIWIAEIRFIDGETITYAGDISLLR